MWRYHASLRRRVPRSGDETEYDKNGLQVFVCAHRVEVWEQLIVRVQQTARLFPNVQQAIEVSVLNQRAEHGRRKGGAIDGLTSWFHLHGHGILVLVDIGADVVRGVVPGL